MTKPKPTMSDVLRNTIQASGKPLLTIEQDTGIDRRSIGRFLRGERSLRLDKADALAEYFGLELRKREG